MGVPSCPTSHSSEVVHYQHRTVEDRYLTALAGAAAGVCASFCVCPLDVVKTRLQGQIHSHSSIVKYRGTVDTIHTIMKEEGVRGLYRGLSPTLLGMVPTWTTYFTAYNFFKSMLETNDRQEGLQFSKGQIFVHMLSACGAGIVTATVSNPFWVVKTRIQMFSRHSCPYRGTMDAFLKIPREEGIAALYKGLGPSLLGVSHITIQYPMYERLKLELAKRQRVPIDENFHTELGVPSLVAAAAGSKIFASVFTYPHEVVRTRMIMESDEKSGLLLQYVKLWREAGIRGLYRAFFTNVFRVIPSSAVTFVSYELVYNWLVHCYGKDKQESVQRVKSNKDSVK
ncbi:mitochondrial carrier protein [Guillardia theta CCMP2712]|uniref:Mitochondrial carrier protein n=1 Tax=Guillardia theta (strain CCMP2712) TaxID=905079 RepID=L1JDI6_GUITC|nr:mitochondrial carrier protein [Guillardia theta CCMP2712]EKX46581.1 mitochondrial carrier protein [Guillardia theta CCMP2712]|eukprot:XP_005833561.1 mitochondrial carrier protein [Guillardia theta CCMP2712]